MKEGFPGDAVWSVSLELARLIRIESIFQLMRIDILEGPRSMKEYLR